MLEIAGNVMLPDNGASWQRLRSGDMTDVPSLTSSSDVSSISRDPSGNPVSPVSSFDELYSLYVSSSDDDEAKSAGTVLETGLRSGLNRSAKVAKAPALPASELHSPPPFMIDPNHEQALDKLVRWMISPQPADRPVVRDLLLTGGVQFVSSRRRAGATVYEGNWGPADEVLQDDAEMIDV